MDARDLAPALVAFADLFTAVNKEINGDTADVRVQVNADAEVVSDMTARKLLQIESLTFKDGNKWRVSDGNATYHVAIEDREFLAKIDAGERFGKGDALVVDLRQVQTIEGAKLLTESIIVKMIEHRKPRQQSLL